MGKPETGKSGKRNDALYEFLDWLKYILVAVLIGLLLVVFVIQRNSVIGNSMLPNLHDNDQLLVEKVSKHFGGIGYGDIITISTRNLENHEGNPNIIKRVIGLPGDTIEIREDGVYRNSARLGEPYLAPDTETRIRTLSYAKVTLGEKEYYVMGDNRAVSLDSRSFGPVPLAYVIGETLFRFYPFDQFGVP